MYIALRCVVADCPALRLTDFQAGTLDRPNGASAVWLKRVLAICGLLLCGLTAPPVLAQGEVKLFKERTLGVVINLADPYSVAVGEDYVKRRGVPNSQVLRVTLPLRPELTLDEFNALDAQIRAHMGPQVLGLALAWAHPYAVQCNSITSALTLGFDAEQCEQTCAPGKLSRHFESTQTARLAAQGARPSMLLAGRSIDSGLALTTRGLAADASLGRLGAPSASAVFVSTGDAARNVRAPQFPAAGFLPNQATRVIRIDERAEPVLPEQAPTRVVLYQTGAARPAGVAAIQWVPGALADHLTSSGGHLLDREGQMTALDWLEAGATASYGTVSEPCNYPQKFPHPQVLLANYLRGATALEAYWRSVAWPAQGVFVGEPLAAPYAR